MSILRIRDASGRFVAIPSIKGEKGDKGDAGSVTAVNGISPDGSGNVKLGVVHPRNLLDNSDFTNPVNQRGKTSYAEIGYTIDRWKNNYTSDLSIVSGGIHLTCSSENQWFVQYLSDEAWNTLKGKAFTIAACTDDGSIYVSTKTMPAGTDSLDSSQISMGSSGYLVNLYKPANGRPMARIFSRVQGSEVTLRWAALYEGTYTRDTLPPYVPKGYAAELEECQRYYFKIGDEGRLLRAINMHSVNTYSAYAICTSVIFPKPMRAKPTVEISYDVNDGDTIIGAPQLWSNKYCTMPNVAVPAGQWFDCHYVTASADL